MEGQKSLKKGLLLKNATNYFTLGLDGLTCASAPGRIALGFLEKTSTGDLKFDSRTIYVPSYAFASLGATLNNGLKYYECNDDSGNDRKSKFLIHYTE